MHIMLSIIVTTYNWPQALKLVLAALASQVTPEMEVIIADDGSNAETSVVVENFKNKMQGNLIHIWQPDEGFQAAKIRNKAIAKAKGEYLIFIDGDCIITKDFIQNHLKLKQGHYFVTGNRVLLKKEFTSRLLTQIQPSSLHEWGLLHWIKARWKNKINRFLPCVKLKILMKLVNLFSKQRWQGAKTCNLAVWKKDLINVNGFDENFTGWGFEDSDLIVRLLRKGIKRKEARFYAPVIHLWHPEQSRDKVMENYHKLEQVIKSNSFLAKKGLDQYGL
jgi:glycosyltransferase involved in cell wall biosynthesis